VPLIFDDQLTVQRIRSFQTKDFPQKITPLTKKEMFERFIDYREPVEHTYHKFVPQVAFGLSHAAQSTDPIPSKDDVNQLNKCRNHRAFKEPYSSEVTTLPVSSQEGRALESNSAFRMGQSKSRNRRYPFYYLPCAARQRRTSIAIDGLYQFSHFVYFHSFHWAEFTPNNAC
jgi:hypothetical protein